MQSYVLMLQADEDDQYLAQELLADIGYAKKNPAIPRLLVPGCRSATANKISGVLFYY